jgi:hypothetical protein
MAPDLALDGPQAQHAEARGLDRRDALSTQLERSGSSLAVQADGLPIAAHDYADCTGNPVFTIVEAAAIIVGANLSQRGTLGRSPGCGRAGSHDEVGRLRRTPILGAAPRSFSLPRRERDRAATAPWAVQSRGLGFHIFYRQGR